MVQNLRVYFILYVITIKWIECVLVKTEHSSMSKRPRLRSRKILGSLLLAAKMKQQLNIANKFPGLAKSWHSFAYGRHLLPHATPWLWAWREGAQNWQKWTDILYRYG